MLTRTHCDAQIGILGFGAIGRVVAQRLTEGAIPGAGLAAIVDTRSLADTPAPQVDLDEAIRRSDVIVECASPATVVEQAEQIVNEGCDLVISSAGALADRTFVDRLRKSGPGRAVVTSGAIGGLDLLAAGAPFDTVTLRTTKKPAALVQPWMDASRAAEIREAALPLLVFDGDVEQAVELFPRSLNVAAAIAHAVRGDVRVELVADPAAELTSHVVTAAGPMGRYHFRIENLPSADNPRTSAVVPHAVLRTLAGLLNTSVGH
jgi:aspartate dehydrogenase